MVTEDQRLAAQLGAADPEFRRKAAALECDFRPIPEELAAMEIPRKEINFVYVRDQLINLLGIDPTANSASRNPFKSPPLSRLFVEGEKKPRTFKDFEAVAEFGTFNYLAIGQLCYEIRRDALSSSYNNNVVNLGVLIGVQDEEEAPRGEFSGGLRAAALATNRNMPKEAGVNVRAKILYELKIEPQGPYVRVGSPYKCDENGPLQAGSPEEVRDIIKEIGTLIRKIDRCRGA